MRSDQEPLLRQGNHKQVGASMTRTNFQLP